MIRCDCGSPTIIQRSYTSMNLGRRFHCCSRQGRSCGFVCWAEEIKKDAASCTVIARCNGPLTPNATTKFDEIKKDAASCTVIWCGPSKYQVSGPYITEQRVVNIDQRTCSCRRWDLTGMPCRHAVACIWNMRLNGIGDGIPEKYVDKAYWLETWKKVYVNTIEPINGMDMWPKSRCPSTLVSPKYHKQAGRPKKKRKKSAVELQELRQTVETCSKMPRKANSLSCTKCKGKGHNKRTCSSTGPPSVAGSSSAAGSSGVAAAGSSGVAAAGT